MFLTRLCLLVTLCLGLQLTLTPSVFAESADTTAGTATSEMLTDDTATLNAEGADGTTIRKPGMFEKFEQGGIIAYLLVGLSIVMIAILFERIVNLQRQNILPQRVLDESRTLWDQKKYKELIALCDNNPSTISRIVRALVIHRTSSSLELGTLAGDIASQDMRAHVQKLVPFALIAAIAPLLGLLGTVSGMIDSFDMVAVAGSLGDASVLADGISKALVTTAVGLIVAVPAIICFNLLKARTNRMALTLDYEANCFLSEWFMEQAEEEDEAAAHTDSSTSSEGN